MLSLDMPLAPRMPRVEKNQDGGRAGNAPSRSCCGRGESEGDRGRFRPFPPFPSLPLSRTVPLSAPPPPPPPPPPVPLTASPTHLVPVYQLAQITLLHHPLPPPPLCYSQSDPFPCPRTVSLSFTMCVYACKSCASF